MRRIGKVLLWLVAIQVVARVVARVVAHLLPGRGGPESDEVDIVTVLDGSEFRSSATAFARASAVTVLGGTVLDLRGVTAAPEGARISLLTILGGVEIAVPEGWTAQVTGTSFAGGHDVGVPGPGPDNAPTLLVDASTYFGGVSLRT